ncbi:amidase signature domain-containing protein [Kockovaella imperatae]|uniref:amidase n=1 Tax=Kockovaella imperatae TaxID=4999 RepID=A0A1Y1UBR6_9TREE|nr:amidase signature domain-containing protein [Kockovaella imperatae]ORX35483.1 amidase signature domain-containing protein [Kockovaella imperatae]
MEPRIWQQIAVRRCAEVKGMLPKGMLMSSPPPSSILDVSDIPRKFLDISDILLTEKLTISELLGRISAGSLTATQVINAFFHRACIAHQLTNCLTEVFFDRALERAAELDRHLKATGQVLGPLHGLPISLKDQIDVQGTEQNMCYVGLVGTKARDNAVIVDILLRQGAILYCKTNMAQGIMGAEGYNNVYGRTLNPLNRSLTCGGSSGGEGALIGMRGALMGVGSDIGGSIRLPAAFQGLYALKPSYGRIPYANTSSSFEGQETIRSVLGPITASVDGLKVFTKAVLETAPWDCDPWTPRMPWSEERYNLIDHGGLKGPLCFAILWDDKIVKPSPPYWRALKELKSALLHAGHFVTDWEPFKMEEAAASWMDILNADGGKDLKQHLALSGEPRLNDVLDRSVTERSVSEYWRLCHRRTTLMKESLDHWMSTATTTPTQRPVDAIVAPVAGCVPMRHDEPLLGNYTTFCNLMDYTTALMPVTKVLPHIDTRPPSHEFYSSADQDNYTRYDPELYRDGGVGIQIIGKRYEEEAVIRMTEIADQALKVHLAAS